MAALSEFDQMLAEDETMACVLILPKKRKNVSKKK
jgi:hypothetical protein